MLYSFSNQKGTYSAYNGFDVSKHDIPPIIDVNIAPIKSLNKKQPPLSTRQIMGAVLIVFSRDYYVRAPIYGGKL